VSKPEIKEYYVVFKKRRYMDNFDPSPHGYKLLFIQDVIKCIYFI